MCAPKTKLMFNDRAPEYKARVERVMEEFIATQNVQGRIGEAIKYAISTDGKRIRPLLVYATAELLGVARQIADYPATAIELVHIYSLVHDDLPSMDDDDLRRGKPTVHKRFDEATGILVGDALLTFAFELLSQSGADPSVIVEWVQILSNAAGAKGMVAGQSKDLEGQSSILSLGELERMHRQKSGALIEACLLTISNNAVSLQVENINHKAKRLKGFGHHIGLAFQICDDLLDVEGSTELLGKPQGSDAINNKSTFVSIMGLEPARDRMHQELRSAKKQLASFGSEAEGLNWIADYVVSRTY